MKSKRLSPLVGLALLGSGSLAVVAGPMAPAHAAEVPAAKTGSGAALLACNLSNPVCIIISGVEHLECVSGVVNACV